MKPLGANALDKIALWIVRRIDWRISKWHNHLEQYYFAPRPSAEEKVILENNRLFYDCHKGRRAFIIGNGPSLKKQDLSLLGNELTFVMSGFWKHPIVEQWQPNYYFFADPLFFDGSEPMQKFFTDMTDRVRTTTFFAPITVRDTITTKRLLPQDKTHYIWFGEDFREDTEFEPDLTSNFPGVWTVAQMALMTAMYMGCSPIYLLGFDHDLLANQKTFTHFYEGTTIDKHPVADGKPQTLGYKFLLTAVLKWWIAYEAIQRCALRRNTLILNATNGGFLDVFKRVGYESIFFAAQ